MHQQSTIFFNDLTVIDFSVVTTDGLIMGGSAQLSLSLTGAVDSTEGVVVDFSEGKKLIKRWIDGEDGFDHKCWINHTDPNMLVENDGERVKVMHRRGGALSIAASEDAFAFVGADPALDIEQFLNSKFADEGLPVNVSDVTLTFDPINVPNASTSAVSFRYVHGLKNSSSYGCKNIAHGHKSFMSATLHNGYNVDAATLVLESIAADLNNAVFVHTEDIQSVDEVGYYKIGYTTNERGAMSMSISQKMIFLETQTTIEHIIEYIRAKYYDHLVVSGVDKLYVSEGLSKGAVVSI